MSCVPFSVADGDRLVKTFWDPITDGQRIVLQLLDVSTTQFGAEN